MWLMTFPEVWPLSRHGVACRLLVLAADGTARLSLALGGKGTCRHDSPPTVDASHLRRASTSNQSYFSA
jgi:hypothetical protein